MAFFRRESSRPHFVNYSADHFRVGVQRILWGTEKVLVDGFFEDGPDPLGEEDVLKGLLGGSSHTYLAVTSWRIILGYLANGQFSSHEYSNTNPTFRQVGSAFYFTYTNPVLKAAGSSNCRSTYSVSKEVVSQIKQHLTGLMPALKEETKILLTRKSWGEGPLADLARAKSGREYMPIELCKACGSTNLVPDDVDDFPEKGNKQCRVCLRIRSN